MQRSYIDYSMAVIVGRALPDVRDGLKPVHRRVLYAMYDGGYRPDRGFSKCARVVGEVMGQYHPHGDSAIYDTLVRLAQPRVIRAPPRRCTTPSCDWRSRGLCGRRSCTARATSGPLATTRPPRCATPSARW